MPKYRKKQLEIEAIQLTTKVTVDTPEGTMTAEPGDWIAKGIENEIYIIKDSIFKKTYDKVEDFAPTLPPLIPWTSPIPPYTPGDWPWSPPMYDYRKHPWTFGTISTFTDTLIGDKIPLQTGVYEGGKDNA